MTKFHSPLFLVHSVPPIYTFHLVTLSLYVGALLLYQFLSVLFTGGFKCKGTASLSSWSDNDLAQLQKEVVEISDAHAQFLKQVYLHLD